MYFKLPYANYFRNNYTYTEVFVLGYAWDLLVIGFYILIPFVVILITRWLLSRNSQNKQLSNSLIFSEETNNSSINKSDEDHQEEADNHKDNIKLIQDSASHQQQQRVQQNGFYSTLCANPKTKEKISSVLLLVNQILFILLVVDLALILLLFFSFGHFGYSIFSQILASVLIFSVLFTPEYIWLRIHRKVTPQSLTKQSNKKLLIGLIITILSISIISVQSVKGGCASGYNDKFGVYAGDQFYVSTTLSRLLSIDKVCPDNQLCHVYTTLPQKSDTSVFINAHAGLGLEKLTVVLEEIKKNEIGDANYSFGGEKTHNKSHSGKFVQNSSFTLPITNVESIGQRLVHSLLFDGLSPSTTYQLSIYNPLTSQQPQLLFNSTYLTLPSPPSSESDSVQPLRIVFGGDIGVTSKAQSLIDHFTSFNPHAIVIGGDTAYDDAQRYCYYCWDNVYDMFDSTNKKLNRIIPLILAVGNHDVGFQSLTDLSITYEEESVPLFFLYNPQHFAKNWIEKNPENENHTSIPTLKQRQQYHYHLLGPLLLYSLDSGYLNGFSKDQLTLMDRMSTKYQGFYKMATFHNPIYPSCIDLTPERNDYYVYLNSSHYWVPMFDKHQFVCVFEHHTHHMKITHPLKNSSKVIGFQDADNNSHVPISGTRYVGDGSWGVRQSECQDAYLNNFKHLYQQWDVSASSDHVWLVTIEERQSNRKGMNVGDDLRQNNETSKKQIEFQINYTAIGVEGNRWVEQIDLLPPFNSEIKEDIMPF